MAANPSGDLRIEVIAAYNLIVDSNVESPSTYAPRSAYLGAKFYNDGTNDLTNVVAYIGNYLGGSGDTPGIYPSRAQAPLVGPLPGSQFALWHEGGSAGTADATRNIGTIKAGEYKVCYWLIGYPNIDENGDAVWGPSVKPDDDLWLEYDIWASATDAGASITADETRKVTMRNEISAMANKIYPNSANKVPQEYQDLMAEYQPAWTNIPEDGSVGTSFEVRGVWYDLGNVGDGFDNNGDLVPDKNAWLQPVGDPTIFDSSAFRLVRTHAFVVIKLKSGGEQVYIVDDQLYFENIPENNGAVGLVEYVFVPMKAGASATLSPYQEVASGFDNEKFNGDYGAGLGSGGSFVSGTSTVSMVKNTLDLTSSPGSNIWYTISFTNSGTLALGDPANGTPLVIQDSIPTGTLYLAGSAASSNVLPGGVTSYAILYSTNRGTSWVSAEPAPATNVTDIQWWLTDKIQPGSNGIVRFAATVVSPFTNPIPRILNTAGISFGSTTPFQYDDATTLLLGTNVLGDMVFIDSGTGGGIFGNGLRDGTETGISNITVKLYIDLNTNGTIDVSDILLNTAVTGTNGNYLFTSLFDGYYIAAVDTDDTDLPLGYTTTTSTWFAINLDYPKTNSVPVTNLTADFGFAPALNLIKSGTNSVREGKNITYTISVTNRFSGNGGIQTYTLWATNYNPDSDYSALAAWTFPSNSYYPPYPDGTYATCVPAGGADKLGLEGHKMSAPDGNISKVELMILFTNAGGWTAGANGDEITLSLYTNNNATPSPVAFSTNMQLATLPVGLTNVIYDVTSIKSWNWSDFIGSNVIVAAGKKVGGPDGGTFGVDQMGFRITSDQTMFVSSNASSTISIAPITDTYDADLLQFISASPAQTTSTTNGSAPNTVGTLYWSNVGPIFAGQQKTLTVNFLALEPPNNYTSSFTNVAFVANAYYGTGKPANSSTGTVVTTNLPAGRIGDFLWRDIDGDGVQDGGTEVGISGVNVVLTPPAGVDVGNGAGNPITNVTDATGWYSFTGLPASGDYTVTVQTNTILGGGVNTWDRDGNSNNATTVSIVYDSTNGADTVVNADFGYRTSTMIDGHVWHDLNRNGVSYPDIGEDWLTNITVYLFTGTSPGTPATAIATNKTSASGYFSFLGNYSGSYTIQVVNGSGAMTNATWVQSFDSDGILITPNYAVVNVSSGGTAHVDYSYYKLGSYSLGDTLYYDWDGDKIQDANDEGVSGITVWLYEDQNSNGVVDAGIDALAGSAETTVNGRYLFSNLPATNYIVLVDQSDPDFPLNYNITADPYGANDGYSRLFLATNRLDQDFGYQPYGSGSIGDTVWRDMNGDDTQSGTRETGISNITVTLYCDFNGDGTYVSLQTASTDVTGKYLFTSLPDGDYRVVVTTNDTDMARDGFGYNYTATTSIQYDISITNGAAILTADFGFAPLGAIGDTIFWDANENGTQDFNESGMTNVTVSLYNDNNTNGIWDAGDTLYGGRTTDTNGNYIFNGLPPNKYVVVVESNAVNYAVCSADPDADGVPYGPGCDGMYDVTITYGTSFMGADFGYKTPGVLGDLVWQDLDADGVLDDNESGLPYITIQLYTNGVLFATNVTDSDGYYMFSNLPDGKYTVEVLTNNLPEDLLQVYDADGIYDHQTTNIIMSAGVVTNVAGLSFTNSLGIDFGYRYGGTNVLSGTIGLDGTPTNGVMGTGNSGYATNEVPYPGVAVYLYLKNTNGAPVFISSTATSTNGDYSFTGLPSGRPGASYMVSISAPDFGIKMTTTNGCTPATNVTETLANDGSTLSAYQVVPVAPAVTNMDFAFYSLSYFDFGDLPQVYSTLMSDSPAGARHKLKTVPNLYLDGTVDWEMNGQPTVDATGDGSDEDGIGALGVWQTGTNMGCISVSVGKGSGWLVGYIDLNNDGDMTDPGEMIANFAASTNGGVTYTNYFTIRTNNVISATNTTSLYGRFRLFQSAPVFPEFSNSGATDNGEVEDYRWHFGALGDYVWKDVDFDGTQDTWEPPITNARVFVDYNANGLYDTNEPFAYTGTNGYYGIGGVRAGTYTIRVDTNTLPSYVTPSYDLDGTSTAHRASVTMTNGQVKMDVDFGYVGMALGGQVWFDIDTDGIQDESPFNVVSNIIVRLYDSNTNWIGLTQTDTNGSYIFDVPAPGNYFLEFYPLTYIVSAKDQGGNDDLDCDVTNSAPYFTSPTYIAPGERELNWDMGVSLPSYTNTIGDRIWIDDDHDGIQDPEETAGVANLRVSLYDETKTVEKYYTLTDVQGYYYLSGITPSNYYVKFSKPSDFFYSPTNYSDIALNSDANQTNGFGPLITVTSGMNNLTFDAGIYALIDVSVQKTASVTNPDPNEIIWFTMVASNAGPSHATGLTLTDTWPTNITYMSHAASAGTTYTASNGLWNIGTLSSGAVATLVVTGQVTSWSIPGTRVTNSIAVSSMDRPDTNTNNNRSSVTVVVTGIDVGLGKVVNNDNPWPGSNVTYTIVVTNYGSKTATELVITEPLTNGLTYVSHSVSAGTYNYTNGNWSIASLGVSNTASLSITASVWTNYGGRYLTNFSRVVSLTQTDTNPSNNTDDAVVRVYGSDLQLSKSSDKPYPGEGERVTYTITIYNNGPNVPTNIVVYEPLALGISYYGHTLSAGSYSTNNYLWQIPSLDVSNSATLSIQCDAWTNSIYKVVVNTSTIIQSSLMDPKTNNNSASAVINVTDPKIFKYANPSNYVAPGSNITYTIISTNQGFGIITGVDVDDYLPTGSTYVASSAQMTAPYTTNANVRDNFGSVAFTNSDGTLPWLAAWTEIGESDGAAGGKVSIAIDGTRTNTLRLNNASIGAWRMADLSAYRWAELSLSFRRQNYNANEFVDINVSSNGGAAWTTVGTITGLGGSDAGYSFTNIVIDTYLSTNTAIQLLSSASGANNHIMYIDDVNINVSNRVYRTTATSLPNLVTNWVMYGREYIINTYSVSIPTNPTVLEITNTASIITDLPMPPKTSTTRTPVYYADLGVIKNVNTVNAGVEGEVIWYTLIVTNYGRFAATNVEITEVWPEYVTFSNAVPSTGTYNIATHKWSGFDVSSNGYAMMVITGIVATTNSDIDITNTAYVSRSPVYDPNRGNNTGKVAFATLAVLSRFEVIETGGKVVVEWETGAEINTVGFDLYRRGSGREEILVNRQMIPAMIGSPQGGIYSIVDNSVKPGDKVKYVLVETERSGRRNYYGPFSTVAGKKKRPGKAPDGDIIISARTSPSKQARLEKAKNEKLDRLRSGSGISLRKNASLSTDVNTAVSVSSYTPSGNLTHKDARALEIIWRTIMRAWKQPDIKGATAEVLLNLDNKGNIGSWSFVTRSGNEEFDYSVELSIETVKRYERFDEELVKKNTKITVIFRTE